MLLSLYSLNILSELVGIKIHVKKLITVKGLMDRCWTCLSNARRAAGEKLVLMCHSVLCVPGEPCCPVTFVTITKVTTLQHFLIDISCFSYKSEWKNHMQCVFFVLVLHFSFCGTHEDMNQLVSYFQLLTWLHLFSRPFPSFLHQSDHSTRAPCN